MNFKVIISIFMLTILIGNVAASSIPLDLTGFATKEIQKETNFIIRLIDSVKNLFSGDDFQQANPKTDPNNEQVRLAYDWNNPFYIELNEGDSIFDVHVENRDNEGSCNVEYGGEEYFIQKEKFVELPEEKIVGNLGAPPTYDEEDYDKCRLFFSSKYVNNINMEIGEEIMDWELIEINMSNNSNGMGSCSLNKGQQNMEMIENDLKSNQFALYHILHEDEGYHGGQLPVMALTHINESFCQFIYLEEYPPFILEFNTEIEELGENLFSFPIIIDEGILNIYRNPIEFRIIMPYVYPTLPYEKYGIEIKVGNDPPFITPIEEIPDSFYYSYSREEKVFRIEMNLIDLQTQNILEHKEKIFYFYNESDVENFYYPGEFEIQDNYLEKDNKKLFPIVLWTEIQTYNLEQGIETFQKIDSAGINFVLSKFYPPLISTRQNPFGTEYYTKYKLANLTNHLLNNTKINIFYMGKKSYYLGSPEEPIYNENEIVYPFIEFQNQSDKFLGWFIADEPVWRGIGEDLEETYNLIRNHDTSRPTFINFASAHRTDNLDEYVQDIREYSQYADIVSVGTYPVEHPCYEGNIYCILDNPNIDIVGDLMDLYKNEILFDSPEKPIWMLLHASEGTPAQKRFMTHQAIIHGATGIIYWDDSALLLEGQRWSEFSQLTSELSSLSEVLISTTLEQEINTEDGIEYITKGYGRKNYILSVNRNNSPYEKTFNLGGAYPNKIIEVINENRTIRTNSQGSFTDLFEPYDTHLYRYSYSRQRNNPLEMDSVKEDNNQEPIKEI